MACGEQAAAGREGADLANCAFTLVLLWRRRSGRVSKRPAVAPTSRRGTSSETH